MGRLQYHKCDINLPPVIPSLVVQLIQHLRNVMMTIIGDDVVISLLKFFVGPGQSIVPLLRRVSIMIELEILQGTAKGKLSRMHPPSSYKIKDSSIGFADAGVADAREAASDAGQCGPNDAVRIAVVLDVNLHVDLELRLHMIMISDKK